MSEPPVPAAKMKTRDIVKYTFATFLGVMTILAIATLFYAKHRRQARSAEETQRIEQVLSAYGQQGQVPPKVETSQPAEPQ